MTGVQQSAEVGLPGGARLRVDRGSTLALITCDGAFDEANRSYVDNLIVYARARSARRTARRNERVPGGTDPPCDACCSPP